MHILEGKTITKAFIAEDKHALLFLTDKGEEIRALTDGDCCSHTWIEHVENAECLFDATVTAVENIHMPQLPEPEDSYDVIAYYGCKITTNKGNCIIDYRNSSNGYYGGNLEWQPSNEDYQRYYGGVWGQNVSSEQWKLLTEQ